MTKPTVADAERWLEQVKTEFGDFKRYRQTWDQLVQRELEPSLDARLGGIPVTYKTPDLEEAEHDFGDILTMNPTRFAGNLREQGSHAEDAMADAVLVASHTWALVENRGRWIDRSNAIGQSRYGLNIMRMLHRPIEEPDYKTEDERDDALKDMPWPFYFEDVEVVSCGWLKRQRTSQVFCYEYEIPVIEATEAISVLGKQLNGTSGAYDDKKAYVPAVDQVGKLAWVGDPQDIDAKMWDKKLRGLIVEYQDKDKVCPICPDKHPLWCGIEILYGADESVKDGTVIAEYTLPYKHAGSFRIVPGRTSNSRNPHFHYRPLEYRLLVEATVINWCRSVLMLLANRDSAENRLYSTLAGMPGEVADRLPHEFWDNMKVELPDSNKGEAAILPGKLEAWPAQMSQILWDIYLDAQQRFENAKPNRFLKGENYDEAAQGTGTANLQSLQQSRLPFSWLLSQSDTFILEAKEDQHHAIRYWDYESDTKTEMRFYVSLGGEEPTKGLTPTAGEARYISASKLAHAFDLVLVTESETLQEQAQKRQQAYEAYDRGWIDDGQVIEAMGYYDVASQQRKIAKYQLRREMAPIKRNAQKQVLTQLMAVISDISPELLVPGMGGPTPPPPSPMQPQPAPAPAVTLPPVQGPSGGPMPIGGGMP